MPKFQKRLGGGWVGWGTTDHNSAPVLLVAMEISRRVAVAVVVEEGYRRGQIIM